MIHGDLSSDLFPNMHFIKLNSLNNKFKNSNAKNENQFIEIYAINTILS